MHSFTVRRRKPRPKTPPPQQEEVNPNVEEKESDEEVLSELSDTSEYLDEALEDLKLNETPPQRRQVRFEPPNAPKRHLKRHPKVPTLEKKNRCDRQRASSFTDATFKQHCFENDLGPAECAERLNKTDTATLRA